ncbi:MAG: hypothetical protein IPJ94_26640 [Chloroflexi bacterium]|nr:hypothetical protein [Chloroflexota bacterium]
MISKTGVEFSYRHLPNHILVKGVFMRSKSLFYRLAEVYEQHRSEQPEMTGAKVEASVSSLHKLKWFLPNGGTLLIVLLLILTQQVWANNGPESVNTPGPSATTVNYQGRLAAPDGTPKNGTFGMSFAIWDAASGGNVVWGAESHAAVPVTDGLFNVGLGSQTSGGIPTTVWNGDRYLEIAVGGETLTPRELIRSVPVASMALTVPDGAITSSKPDLTHVTNYDETDVSTDSTTFIPLQQVTINLEKAGHLLLTWQSHASSNIVNGGGFLGIP